LRSGGLFSIKAATPYRKDFSMKMVFATLATLIGFSASAATTVFVSDNVYTASGPATKNYFTNLNQISAEFNKVSKLELGALRFAGASVDAEKNTIRYSFQKMDDAQGRDVCWSSVAFTVAQTEAGPVVSDVKAEKTCYKEQD
jgi:hypothetical protein